MKDKKFKEILAKFKTDMIDVIFDEPQFYEKEFGDFIISFEYTIWESELSKTYFTEIEDLEIFNTEKDEEVDLTDMQQLMFEEVAKSLVDLEYQEYEHPSTYAYNIGD